MFCRNGRLRYQGGFLSTLLYLSLCLWVSVVESLGNNPGYAESDSEAWRFCPHKASSAPSSPASRGT